MRPEKSLKIYALLFVLAFLIVPDAIAGWDELETGIEDDLTGVVFWEDYGALSGHSGIYYTTDGGDGALSWTRFNIEDNFDDSVLYNNTQFNHLFADNSDTDYAFACGEDTVNDKAIILQFHIPTQAYTILYEGEIGTSLNNINYSNESDQYFAVGNEELIINFNLDIDGEVESTGGTIDFTSISFYSDKFNIGANGYKIYGVDYDPDLSYSITPAPGVNFKDAYKHASYYCFGVGNSMFMINSVSGLVTENSDYKFGPLNGNSIHEHNDHYFIGTDHGIFFLGLPPSTIEWQPTSYEHFIYDFWSEPLSSNLFACGKDGILLKTLDDGGLPLPFVSVTENGGCKNEYLTMHATEGSSVTCEWYLDDVLVSSSCGDYSATFDETGSYEIKLVGTNATGSDSSLVYFSVVDTPMINLPITVHDTILCKEEIVEITLDTTENDVFYSLYQLEPLVDYGESPVGDGEALTFTTELVSETGDYALLATSSLAECSKIFTDTIHIEVEKTKAEFHTGKYNVIADELVNFYENCTEADNYEWNFPSGSAEIVSFLPDLINSFTVPGSQSVTLIAWSDNECYDTIVKNGPTVFVEPEIYDSCWVNIGNGNDLPWVGYYFPHIYDLKEVTNGYITCGASYDQAFATTYGDSLNLFPEGAYLSKYDKNGVHKWSVHAEGTIHWEWERFLFKSAVQDGNGNIIAAGHFSDNYIDNSGDTIQVPTSGGKIIKMDSLGRNIWTRSAQHFFPEHVIVDNSDNIIISSERGGGSIKLYHNDIPLDTLYPYETFNRSLTKLDPDGYLLWDVPIYNNNTNPVYQRCPQVDDSNNVYLASTIENGATIYDVDNPSGISIPSYGLGKESYLAKFDSAGHHLWNIHTETDGAINDGTEIHDLYTDGAGNSYFSGLNHARAVGYGYSHQVFSVDESYVEDEGGAYFVAKVNSDGMAQWVKGAYSSKYGYGYEIDVKNDTVYVLGQAREEAIHWDTLSFYNSDSSSLELPLSKSDYFIAAYDTLGELLWASKNADNEFWVSNYGWHGFFKGDNNSFYSSQSGQTSYDWIDFGDTINPTNGLEAWVTKMCKDCGILIKPQFRDFVDTTVCLGTTYTFIDGDVMEITEDVVDTVTFISETGLDSLIITDIKVNGYGYLDIVDSVWICTYADYVFPDGSEIDSVVIEVIHENVFTTLMGCDSIITTVLIPYPLYDIVDSVYHCPNQPYVFPDLTSISGIDGIYSHISELTTDSLCDSTITTILIPLPEYYHTDSVTICSGDDYAFPDGSVAYDIMATLTQESVFDTPEICDSTIVTVLLVNDVISLIEYDTICIGEGYIFPDGTIISDIAISVTHASILSDVSGCDSIIETHLHAFDIDNSITQDGVDLVANHLPAVDVSYQWVDCDEDNEPIIGETNQVFTPTENGNYAVIITDGTCTEISDCFNLIDVGVGKAEVHHGFSLYPNPTQGIISVQFNEGHNFSKIDLVNPLGQLILEVPITASVIDIEINGSAGIYFLHFMANDDSVKIVKIVKD